MKIVFIECSFYCQHSAKHLLIHLGLSTTVRGSIVCVCVCVCAHARACAHMGVCACLLHLLHWQANSLPLCQLGSPRHSRSPFYRGGN